MKVRWMDRDSHYSSCGECGESKTDLLAIEGGRSDTRVFASVYCPTDAQLLVDALARQGVIASDSQYVPHESNLVTELESGHYFFKTGDEAFLKWDGKRVEVSNAVSGEPRAHVLADDGSYAGVEWPVNRERNGTDVYVPVGADS